MERRGVPTVSLVHRRFESAAKAGAKAGAIAELPMAVVDQEVYNRGTPEEVQKAADDLYPYVVRSLTTDPSTKPVDITGGL